MAETGTGGRFDGMTIALHWTTLALILGMFASAWLYGRAEDHHQAALLLAVHRSLGVTVWAVTLGRLAWRWRRGYRPPLPADMPTAQRVLARANEYTLYALLLIQPVTGMAQSLTRGRPFPVFGLELPRLMTKDRGLTNLFHGVHEASAWVLAGLIGVHALAAIYHGWIRRDGVLRSMTPFAGMEPPAAPSSP